VKTAMSEIKTVLLAIVIIETLGLLARAQDMPGDYQQVLKVVGKSGDYKANVLKVNVPRNDLHITIADCPVPTPFGFGGWLVSERLLMNWERLANNS
jgi:hypothetical protein